MLGIGQVDIKSFWERVTHMFQDGTHRGVDDQYAYRPTFMINRRKSADGFHVWLGNFAVLTVEVDL